MPKGLFGTSAMSEESKTDSVKGYSAVGMIPSSGEMSAKMNSVEGYATRGQYGTRTPESKVEQVIK